MAQDNTKLCDFSNTNNNDFISTMIAPNANAESCEINTTLLNLVMKDQFSGLPNEDAVSHLNNFVDLYDTDIVKLKLFPFSLTLVEKGPFVPVLKGLLSRLLNRD